MRCTFLIALSSLTVLAACGQQSDLIQIPRGSVVSSGGPDGPGNPSSTNVQNSQPKQDICDPFTTTQAGQPGLAGRLFALPDSDPRTNGGKPPEVTDQSKRVPVKSIEEFFEKQSGSYKYLLNGNLFLHSIDVEERSWTAGFTNLSGDTLSSSGGQPLIEFFALSVSGYMQLSDSDAEGNYQLAIVSDDGANLYIDNPGNTAQSTLPFINNDGEHPPVASCALQSVGLKKGAQLPIRFDYFQGPRYDIAANLMWRKIDGQKPAQDPMCRPANFLSLSKKDQSKWYLWKAGGLYQQFLSRSGFKPLKASNFAPLPGAATSQCR